MDDEEWAVCEGRIGCVGLPVVGVYKSPNPTGGTVLRRWLQRDVRRPITKPPELLHTPFVEKQGVVGSDVQRSRKFECETPQEETKQKGGFP